MEIAGVDVGVFIVVSTTVGISAAVVVVGTAVTVGVEVFVGETVVVLGTARLVDGADVVVSFASGV